MDRLNETKQIDTVKIALKKSKNTVFFGGAGVSTASGIPDFRSATGLYNQKHDSSYSPEEMLSHSFYRRHPQEFFKYHFGNLVARNAKPNQAHLALAKLEAAGKLQAVITQNIDGLHQQAGSKNVIELHGNTLRFYCEDCYQSYTLEDAESSAAQHAGVPQCQRCGGRVRPDVVLYQEQLDPGTLDDAVQAVRDADLLIVGGTSLAVYPAAGLVNLFSGDTLVLINHDPTPYDYQANYILRSDIDQVLWELAKIAEEDNGPKAENH